MHTSVHELRGLAGTWSLSESSSSEEREREREREREGEGDGERGLSNEQLKHTHPLTASAPGASSASLVADDIPVFLAVDAISLCSFSS